jgi:SAM-dependent methyltransferase
MSSDRRIFAASTARNREPILAVLRGVLSENSKVLEIASGTGEHAAFIAKAMPTLDWQPSDPDPQARNSIASWVVREALTNVRPPLAIDVHDETWGVEDQAPFAAVVSINMIHIAPWSATLGLAKGAGRLLSDGGILFVYGPFMRDGRHTAPSNAVFDASLKARNAEWGVRDLSEVCIAAERHSLRLREIVEMPANNLSVIFAKSAKR